MKVISPDNHLYDRSGAYVWTPERVLKAWGIANEELRWLAPEATRVVLLSGLPGSGKSTWIQNHGEKGVLYFDATFTTLNARRRVLDILRKVAPQVPVEIVILDVKLETALARNATRPENRQIPEETIRRMEEQMRTGIRPTLEEGFTSVTKVPND
jgi:predicted kinase